MSDEIIGGKWELQELLAVGWSDDMAARFPDADHRGCRQAHVHIPDKGWRPTDPVQCMGWHCNRCGEATNSYGHHACLDRPAPSAPLGVLPVEDDEQRLGWRTV